jgi:hypothetical protein
MTRMRDNSTAASLQQHSTRPGVDVAQAGSVASSTWQVTSEDIHEASCPAGDPNSVRRSLASLIARQIASDLKCLPGGSPEDRETGEGLTDDASATTTSRTAKAIAGRAKRSGCAARSPSQPLCVDYPNRDFRGGE